MLSSQSINIIIEEYNMMMNKSQNIAIYTRGIEIQKSEIENLEKFDLHLEKIKQKFIKTRNENFANLALCLQLGARAISFELKMLVNLKEDKMVEAWNCLIEAQNLTGIVIRNHPFDRGSLSGYKMRLQEYEKTLFPKMMFSSVGGIIKISKCSICGNDYDDCDHIKGKLYMGKMCSRIIKEMDLEEISLVENPEDKRCRIISTSDKGANIDTLTLRIE